MAAADYIDVAQQLYVSYFGRPADPYGLDSYIKQLDALGAPKTIAELETAVASKTKPALNALVNSFNNSDESIKLYGNDNTQLGVSKFVAALYQNIFGREADVGGAKWWIDEILSGRVTRANAALSITQGAFANTSDEAKKDQAAVLAKLAVAKDFTTNLDTITEINAFSGEAAAATARGLLSGVTSATVPADYHATVVAAIETVVTGSVPTTNNNLTAGVDTLVGGIGNDTFNGANSAAATWSGLDSIDGGAGKDTLNLADTTGGIDLSLGSVKNVETAVITSVGALAGNAGNVSGWTGLTSATFSLKSTSAQTITAADTTAVTVTNTAGATIVGGSSINVTAGSAPTALVALQVAVAGAANAAAVNALTAAAVTAGTITAAQQTAIDTAATTSVAAAATATQGYVNGYNVTATSNGALASATVKGGQVVTITDGSTKADQLKSVSLDGNAGAATLTGKALTTVTVANGVAASDVEVVNATAGHTLNLNVTANASGVVVKDAEATTVNVTAVTKKSNVAIDAAKATTINAAGDVALTLDSTGAVYTALTTLNIAGKGGVNADVSGAGALTAVVATTSTGANTITIDATKATYAGGSGVDTVTVLAAPTKALNGGAGTADELVINATAATFSNPSANTSITGFEVLGLGALSNGSYDATGFTSLHSGVTAAAVAFTNVAANTGLLIDGASTGGVTYTLKDATGANDTLNLTLKSAGVLAAGSVTAAGVENVKIVTTDTDSTAHVDTITLVAVDAKSITVSGNAGLNITNTGNVAVTSFDASGVTSGAVTFASANTTATAAVSIKGGAGDDVLTGSVSVDTIVAGAGNDTINGSTGLDIVTGGAGADTFKFVGNANGNVYTTVTDFTKGTGGDKLDLSGLSANAILDTTLGAKITLGATAAFADFLAAAATGHAAAATNAVVTWFQFGGDTYIVVDNTNADVFTNGTAADQVVKLTGAIDLTGATIATEVLTA